MSKPPELNPNSGEAPESLFDKFNYYFNEFWEDLPADFKPHNDNGVDYRQILHNKEQAFLDKIGIALVDLLNKHSGPITIFFDIDETMLVTTSRTIYGPRNYDGEDEYQVIIRPSMLIIREFIDKIMANREYSIGLLTSKPPSSLNKELNNPTYTAKTYISDKLNDGLVISAHSSSPIYGQIGTKLPKFKPEVELEALCKIDEAWAKYIADSGSVNILESSGGKLLILAWLTKQYPNQGLLIIDDQPYPDAIDPNRTQIQGVSLGNEANFDLTVNHCED